MKDITVKTLSEDDQKIIQNMRNIGMSRKASTMLGFLMVFNSGSVADITKATDLRQSEICMASKELAPWITVDKISSGNQSRPKCVYSLDSPKSAIIHYYNAILKNRAKEDKSYKVLLDAFVPTV
jgi:predicted transcriptional regulator